MSTIIKKRQLTAADEETGVESSKTKFLNLALDHFPIFFLVLFVVVFTIMSKGKFLSMYNMKSILKQSFLYIIGGLGEIFLFAQGVNDYSLASNIAISAILATYVSEYSVPLAIVTALAVGTAIGAFNGYLYAYTNINVFTAGLTVNLTISGTLLTVLHKSTYIKVNEWFTQWVGVKYELIAIAIMTCIVGYYFNYMKFGRHCKAIGAGQVAAGQSGVNVKRTKMLAFIITGFTAGILAILTLIRTGSASSGTGAGFNFNVMIGLVLGGVPVSGGSDTKLRGVFIGSLMSNVLLTGLVMMGLQSRVQDVIKGVMFVVVVVVTTKLRIKLKR